MTQVDPEPGLQPTDEKKLERKLPVAFLITLVMAAAGIALLAGLIWAVITRGQ